MKSLLKISMNPLNHTLANELSTGHVMLKTCGSGFHMQASTSAAKRRHRSSKCNACYAFGKNKLFAKVQHWPSKSSFALRVCLF